jgi:misacylated tRNA(Ala) deacylase
MSPTKRLYWVDDHCLEANAVVTGILDNEVALDQTCFYPGGGGQPSDQGVITTGGAVPEVLEVVSVEADGDGVLWHTCSTPVPQEWLGRGVSLRVDPVLRTAHSRYHTVLHVLNAIARRDYGAWITGAQIAEDYSRIDFQWDGFSPALCGALEQKVNAVLAADRRLAAYSLDEEEFSRRTELLRTLEVKPPVVDGRVRVVEIEGFDVQACGGTHVHSTAELGRFEITRTENKGRINKRLYVRLTKA